MNKKDIQNLRHRVDKFIAEGRLRSALNELKNLSESKMYWEITDRINDIERGYTYMLNYMLDGTNDPTRAEIYQGIVNDIYQIADLLERKLYTIEEPTLYYNTLRVLNSKPRRPLGTVLEKYSKLVAEQTDLFSAITSGSQETASERRKNLEDEERSLFKQVWASFPLNSEEYDSLKTFILNSDVNVPSYIRSLIMSAVVLGQMEYYDPKRVMLLMDVYAEATEINLSSIALCGLLLSMLKYKNRPMNKSLKNRFEALRDNPSWRSDLKVAFLEMIRTSDTERINRKMRDEVIPGIMKLRPDILNKINDASINIDEFGSMEGNPEWEEILNKSGLADKIKEMTEIQLEGGDVFMSTFSHLKNFPFFNDIANWFMPFTIDHSIVENSDNATQILAESLANAPFLCDSDKYSFVLSLSIIPESQRAMMNSQLEQQRLQITEAIGTTEMSLAHNQRRFSVSRFLQNIYRFYKLFRRKGEFYDPFDYSINLVDIAELHTDLDDGETLSVIAELYFKSNQWQDAISLYSRIDNLLPPDDLRYQKMGYCFESMGNLEKAIEYYQNAELINADSSWILNRLAATNRVLGNYSKAVGYYRRIADREPESYSATINLAHALLLDGKHLDALKQYYKAEFIDSHSKKAWRGIAWTLFMTGQYADARKYYQKIINENPSAADYMNMGHTEWALNNIREAVNFYRLSIETGDNNIEKFITTFKNDTDNLRKAGVDISLLPLITDAVLYNSIN